jgi:hypothetical protein
VRISIRLGEADRARLGCPDELVFDRDAVTMGQLRKVQHETGILAGRFMAALLDGDGDAHHAMVWLALRQSGVEVEYGELDYLPYESTTDLAPEPGKAQTEPTTSGSSSPSTP